MSLQNVSSYRTMQIPLWMGTLHLILMDTDWDNISLNDMWILFHDIFDVTLQFFHLAILFTLAILTT